MIIRQDSGLCNRLRTVFSFYQAALRDGEPLTVVWEPNLPCPGFFLDYFEPVPGITFVDDARKVEDKIYVVANSEVVTDADFICDCHPDFHHTRQWIYEHLKPLPYILKRVEDNVLACESRFAAVHIRRTDIVGPGGLPENGVITTDKVFYEFLDRLDSFNIYVAADNRETQDNIISKYGSRVKGIKLIDSTNRSVKDALQREPGKPWERLPGFSGRFRHTDLADAIVDLYTCVEANHFKGSGASSFSHLIWQLWNKKRGSLSYR